MRHWKRRVLAAFLALTMALTLVPGAYAQDEDENLALTWEEVDSSTITADLKEGEYEEAEEPPLYADDEQVRVSIVLEDEPALAMFSLDGEMDAVIDYREELQEIQAAAAEYIAEEALDNRRLDVVWNLTLAANIISANVEYGQIEAIKEVPGVADVVVETRYEIQGFRDKDDPNLVISTGMTQTTDAWGAGYTGAGMRIAIIDTGLDIEHQSFNNDAFLHALAEDGDVDSFDLLDVSEISGVLDQLNAAQRLSGVTAGQLYHSEKLPYCFNYVDSDLDVTHVNDTQEEHGSHVAGIAAANRYLLKDGEYVKAWDEVHMVGNAPDAQVLVMKVFGKGGGAYDSDYMAAIEDAIVLGCDTVNLSLGSSAAGMTYSTTAEYQDIMNYLTGTDTVVNISAGNNSYWAEQTAYGDLYSDDVNFQTGGSPGSFTNSLGVASVDNNGTVNGGAVAAFGRTMGYTETSGYGNISILELDAGKSGTDYDFVYVDAVGEPSDFAAVDVAGKIALCNRGTTSFYEKANAAVGAGAIGVIVCNNQEGTISMNLEGYNYTAPVVSITLADAEYIKANAVSGAAGELTYYTGTITVNNSITVVPGTNDYQTMSSFSSWGAPGDLSIKPEITAPGGSIWSLFGYNRTSAGMAGGHDQYETMSGTSMAAPQVTGIGALVKQSIEERGISQPGMTDRALAQSLMMSTAEPLKDANKQYYSVLQQGAGLVDTKAAVTADSYITMEERANGSYADGKVKVELGDDPARTGTYSFEFTIHNLTDESHSYQLSADVFTQNEDDGFLLTSTTPLSRAKVGWSADNVEHEYDFDGNGVVDINDVQALLDVATGNRTRGSLSHAENADFGRGAVDSYSAYQLLDLLAELEIEGNNTVTVPAGRSVTVAATITLDPAEMDSWLAKCPNGVYVEAYVYAKGIATEEGVEGTDHSIPVLGFYGNWTDASMFEKGSYTDYAYGLETRAPYLYDGTAASLFRNAFLMQDGSNGRTYYFGGNPYADEVIDDEVYLEARNALNNENGDKLSKISFTAIRSAAASRLQIKDVKTGEIYIESYPGAVTAAYYYPANAAWQQTGYSLGLNWSGKDANGAALSEDTTVEVSLTLAPERYVNADGSVDWDSLGGGASLTTQVTIDNTAPQLTGAFYDAQNKAVALFMQDNQYVAAAAMFTADGTELLAEAVPNQTEQGVETSVRLDLSQVLGKNFLIALFDYAGNMRTFAFKQAVRPDIADYYTAYDRAGRNWVTYTKNGSESAVIAKGAADLDIVAGAYAGGYVFAVDSANSFYVMEADDLGARTRIASLNGMGQILDMAYDEANGVMYLCSAAGGQSYLMSIDLSTGDLIEAYPLNWNIAALAADRAGNLYGVDESGNLYAYKLDSIKPIETYIGSIGVEVRPGSSSMTWDKTFNTLALAAGNTLYVIDPADGETKESFSVDSLSALFTPALPGENALPPASEAARVTLSRDELTLMKNERAQLSAAVGPWNLADKSVTWYSEDASVAVVSPDGVVTGAGSGTTTITAVSNATPSVYATCEVTVIAIEKDLQALVWDENGAIWWSDFNTASLPDYQKRVPSGVNQLASATMAGDGMIYAATLNENSGTSVMYRVNPYTMESEELSMLNAGIDIFTADLTYAPHVKGGVLFGLYGSYILMIDPATGGMAGLWNYSQGAAKFIAITYEGSIYNTYYNEYMDYFLFLDSDGNLYEEAFMTWNGGNYYFNGLEDARLGSVGYNSGTLFCYNSALYAEADDGNWYLFWSQYDDGDEVNLIAVALDGSGVIANMGSFPSGVWPVGGLMDEDIPGMMVPMDKNHLSSAFIKGMDAVDWLVPAEPDYGSETFDNNDPAGEDAAGNENGGNENAGSENDGTGSGAESELPAAPEQSDIPEEPVPGSGEPETTPEVPEQPPVTDPEPAVPVDGDDSGDDGSDGGDTIGEAQVMRMTALAEASADMVSNTETTATVQITLDNASTNGKLRITYDPSVLTLDPSTLTSGNGAMVTSINASTPGVIIYAYASKDAQPANTVLAELTFTCPAGTTANVTVTTLEDGAEKLNTTVTVPVVTEAADPGPVDPVDPDPVDPDPVDPTPVDPTPEFPAPDPGTGSSRPSGSGSTNRPSGSGSAGTPATPDVDTEIEDSSTPLGPTVSAAALFHDLKANAWYSAYADYVVSKGLMQGTSATEFSPNEPLSRAMLVTILYRAAGSPAVSGTAPFSDVPAGKWYTDGVIWAARNGLVTGYSDGTFRPDAPIVRQELAAILWRYAQQTGLSVAANGTTMPDFADRGQIASWAGEAMSWAYSRGVLTGDGNLLNPAKGATRIETAAMLARFLQLVEKTADPTM